MKNILLLSFLTFSLLFTSESHSNEMQDQPQDVVDGSDLINLIQKICFNDRQIKNGIKEEQFLLDKNETLNILVMNDPNKDENFDCSSNNFSYPFVNNLVLEQNKGFWFGSSIASKIIGKLTTVNVKNAKTGDIIIFRVNNEVTQIGLINVILEKGEEYPEQYIIDFNYKAEVTPPVRYSLEIPFDIGFDAEIYSLENNPLKKISKEE